MVPVTRRYPSPVLLQEQRDDHRLSTLVKEDAGSKVTSGAMQLKIGSTVQKLKKSGDSDQYEKDFNRQLLHWPGLCYLLPSVPSRTEAFVSLTTQLRPPAEDLMDFKLSDAVILAEKALLASKEAAKLAKNLKLLGAELDCSLSPIEVSVDSAGKMVEKGVIVRSTRAFNRNSKRRGQKKHIEVTEIPNTQRLDVKRKMNEGFDHSDPLRLFLWGPETKKLLTAKEESDLISQIQDLARLEDVKQRLQSHLKREPTLIEWSEATGVSNWVLQSQLRSGNRSREKLINANFRMVVHIAKQYQGRGLSLQDLLQEGSRGLMRSVEKFKPQAGCRFATYAYWWIRQAIRKSIFQHSRTIRLPDNVFSLLGKVIEAKKACIQGGHSQPTKEQIAGRVGITVQKLEELMYSARIPVSMQQTVWADQDTTYQEITADSQVETPDISVAKQMMRRHVRGLLSVLSPKERKIIQLRFGIEGGKQRTLSEIGDVFGLSKERVRQLESRAFYKLKRTLGSQGLEAYTDLLM
uniref:RNA polymerase sigma factor n=2 Tax=Kalanchoe fedtschenkoi TaxID=63787 RepID=A0A7N0VJS9_KALFE